MFDSPTPASIAAQAVRLGLTVLVALEDDRQYLGKAVALTVQGSLVIDHAGYANAAHVLGDTTYLPLDLITSIAADLGGSTLLGFAPVRA